MTRMVAVAFVAILLSAAPGCLERKISITSEPPGATVLVNDTEIGRAPATAGFLFYGKFDVQARKEGCEAVTTSRDSYTPFWEYPPFDLIATALPFTITHTEKWHIDLKATDPASPEPVGLIDRARELRAQTLSK